VSDEDMEARAPPAFSNGLALARLLTIRERPFAPTPMSGAQSLLFIIWFNFNENDQ